jgi:hypothetical protein
MATNPMMPNPKAANPAMSLKAANPAMSLKAANPAMSLKAANPAMSLKAAKVLIRFKMLIRVKMLTGKMLKVAKVKVANPTVKVAKVPHTYALASGFHPRLRMALNFKAN